MHICADSSESLSHVVMKKCPSPQFFNRAGSQTLIAGRKSRERESLHGLAHESFVLACFL